MDGQKAARGAGIEYPETKPKQARDDGFPRLFVFDGSRGSYTLAFRAKKRHSQPKATIKSPCHVLFDQD